MIDALGVRLVKGTVTLFVNAVLENTARGQNAARSMRMFIILFEERNKN